MTKREAKKLVYEVTAATLHTDLESVGAGWIYENDDGSERSEADVKRIGDAIEDFVRELEDRTRSKFVRRFAVRR
jgi:hypothetical protein